MCSKSDSSIVMIGNDINKTVQKRFGSFLYKYQIGLEQSMKGNNFFWLCDSNGTRTLYHLAYKRTLNNLALSPVWLNSQFGQMVGCSFTN